MREQCPTCGHLVDSIFDHIAISCEHDMTPAQVAALLEDSEHGGEV